MEPAKNYDSTFGELRRKAGEILAAGANRLLLIEGIAVCLLLVPLYSFFGYAASAVAEVFAPTGGMLALLIFTWAIAVLTASIFVAGPLLFGLFSMAWRMVRGESVVLGDLFYGFSSSDRYLSALAVSASFITRICVALVIIVSTWVFFLMAMPAQLLWMILCGVLITFEIIAAILSCFSTYSNTFSALGEQDFSLTSGHKLSRGLRFGRGFLLWILLGLATFGVLLLWDTFPRMLIAYFCDLSEDPLTID